MHSPRATACKFDPRCQFILMVVVRRLNIGEFSLCKFLNVERNRLLCAHLLALVASFMLDPKGQSRNRYYIVRSVLLLH
jgi:hypothetical protein